MVSNCGGLLTPLGDPPLFLGFLKGVPFEWTLRLWPEWLLVNGVLLVIFHIVDEWHLERDERDDANGSLLEEVLEHRAAADRGRHNLVFLAGVVLVIIGKGRGLGQRRPASGPSASRRG